MFGSDGPGELTLTATDHPDFEQFVDPTTEAITFYKDANNNEAIDSGEAWFEASVTQAGTFQLRRSTDWGTAGSEGAKFDPIKPGAPAETRTATSEFGNATLTFDGLIYDPTTGAYMNNPAVSTTVKGKTTIDRSIDDINADGIGFGIKGTNPDQASQVNHNEAFSVEFEEATDSFTFGVQGIGNNAKSVDIYYDVGVDANNDGVSTAAEITGSGRINNHEVLSGAVINPVEISADATAHRDKGMDIRHV